MHPCRDNACEKINSLQVIKIKGDLPGNPSKLHRLALGFPPVARVNGGGNVDAGDGGVGRRWHHRTMPELEGGGRGGPRMRGVDDAGECQSLCR